MNFPIRLFSFLLPLLFVVSCASTLVTEIPKTVMVPESAPTPEPQVIWTSRGITKAYDYLGMVQARSLTYEGAIDRLVGACQEYNIWQ